MAAVPDTAHAGASDVTDRTRPGSGMGSGAARAAPSSSPRRGGTDPAFLVMLLPVVLLFTGFITFPAVVGMFYSLTDYEGYGDWSFTGVQNYIAIVGDPRIREAYLFTLGFSLVTVLVVNVVSLALAIALNARIGLKRALRSTFFIPIVVSGIVIAYVFNYLFSTSLPMLAESFGMTSLTGSILAEERYAWIAVVIVTAWQAVPGAMIICLAGLVAIPDELYEASSIDGANAWKQFRFVTLPMMVGYVAVNTILGFKQFINAYDVIVGLTDGGPGTATMSVAMTIFTGFGSGDYAYQMANAVLFFVLAVGVSLLQLQLIRRQGVAIR